MVCCGTPKKALICCILGTILCVGCGIVFFYLPEIIDDIAALMLALAEGSIVYPLWKDIPVPLYRQFYMFNYTNIDDFLGSCDNDTGVIVCSTKPTVVELGPYTYKEIRHKKTIKFEGDDLISYREIHNFVFTPELSNGTEEDIIVSPDIVLFSIPKILYENGVIDSFPMDYENHKPWIDLNHLTNMNDTPSPFVAKSAGDLIYRGYIDDLALGGQLALLFREVLPGGVFAYFYGKNATDDCPYEIHRGEDDISNIFEITKWNNSEKLPLWGDPDNGCNFINGSDGTMYSPRTSGDVERVNIYVSDICRSIYFEYYEDTTFHGFDGKSYRSTMDLFADQNQNPDNGCFCGYPDSTENCLGSGISYMGPCKFDAPIFLSHPHYLMSDYKFVDAIDGLNPQESLHRSYLSIEKYSGMPISANIRFQLSVKMYPFYITPTILKNLTYDGTATFDLPTRAHDTTTETTLEESMVEISRPTLAPPALPTRHTRAPPTLPPLPPLSVGVIVDVSNVPEMLLPVMWVNEQAELDQPDIDLLNSDLYIPIKAIYGVIIGLIIIGGLLTLLGIGCTESIAFKSHKRITDLKGID